MTCRHSSALQNPPPRAHPYLPGSPLSFPSSSRAAPPPRRPGPGSAPLVIPVNPTLTRSLQQSITAKTAEPFARSPAGVCAACADRGEPASGNAQHSVSPGRVNRGGESQTDTLPGRLTPEGFIVCPADDLHSASRVRAGQKRLEAKLRRFLSVRASRREGGGLSFVC